MKIINNNFSSGLSGCSQCSTQHITTNIKSFNDTCDTLGGTLLFCLLITFLAHQIFLILIWIFLVISAVI